MDLKGRWYRLTINNNTTNVQTVISNTLNIAFKVGKRIDHTKSLPEATVDIYNLSDDTLRAISGKYVTVVLEVGYQYTDSTGTLQDNTAPILVGASLYNTSKRVGHDRVTTLHVTEGYLPLHSAIISVSFPPSTTLLGVIQGAVQAANALTASPLAIGKVLPSVLTTPLVSGWCHMGTLQTLLNTLAKAYNFTWGINKGVVQFHDKHGTSSAAIKQATVLSSDTGLIRVPTPHEYSFSDLNPDSGKNEKAVRYVGVRLECLLNPHLGPGSVLQVQSLESQFNHWYLIRDIDFVGEWMGASWECVILADQANAVG